MPILTLTEDQVRSFRLHRNYLVEQHPKPIAVVSSLAGLQAQVFSAAKLGLGIRSGVNATKIESYFTRKNGLVKTWAMRGTLYALAAKDLSLFSAALGFDVEERYLIHWKKNYGLDRKRSLQLIETLHSLLTNEPKTRREFSREATGLLGDWVEPLIVNGWGGAIKCQCDLGNAVFSEAKRQETSFVRRQVYVSNWKAYDPHDAQDELLRRYLSSFGPATVSDFGFWLGKNAPIVKAIWDRIRPELTEVQIDGKKAFMLSKDRSFIKNLDPVSNHISLLPLFDAYLLSHRKKSHLVEDTHYKKIFRIAGWIAPTVLYNGRTVGLWSMDKKKGMVAITVKPFTTLDKGVKEIIRNRAEMIGKYFEAGVRVTFS
ncbi:MAG TPA: winged helix DNA-binding domain-containing protein [Candidatus Kapabacteria bacterium]|nr:winged helix DNA-binding domain-containing protein [Candidatus Kapabacteria bacterium]